MGAVSYCWFLTGSQGLYGPETLQQVERQSHKIVDQLEESGLLPLPVQWRPVLTDSEAIHRVMLEANADSNCLGVIAWMHTFSPAKMWIRGLGALQVPLLHLHTQANAALPWSEIDMDFMNLNQAAHGDREFGYIQTRLGVARKTVVGHVSDPSVAARIGAWQRAARGHAAIRRLKLARFGDNMRDVAVTEGDKVDAEIRFGVSVNTWGVNDLVAAVDAASDAEVDDLVQEYGDLYDVVSELRAGGERHESLRYGARIEVGLRHFLTDGGFGAFTTNFQDLGGLRQLPGLAVQRLMADGYGFGGEGDWKTSVMLHTIKAIGAGQPGGTSFMEDYTYDLTETSTRSSAHTCSRSAQRSPATVRGWRSTRSASATARTRSGWCSRQPAAQRPCWASAILVNGSGWSSTRSTSYNRTSRCPSSRLPAPFGNRGPALLPRPSAGSAPADRTTPSSPRLSA